MVGAGTVLVVDDDRLLCDRLARAIGSRGFETRTAFNVDEALEVVGAVSPTHAVVDLKMPGRSGLDLVRELKLLFPEVRIVVLTGYGSIANAVEAMRLGAINYLSKPADAEDVLAAFDISEVQEALSSDRPVEAPSLARAEWEHINRVLADSDGNVSEAARRLGLHRRSLQRKLSKMPPKI